MGPNCKPVVVNFMDGTCQVFQVLPQMTVGELATEVKLELGLKKEHEWNIFERIPSKDRYRSTQQHLLMAEQMEEKENNVFETFVWVLARVGMSRSESVDPDHPDGLLTFYQALREYLRSPLGEQLRLAIPIASMAIVGASDILAQRVLDAVSEGSLIGDGILEQILPSGVLLLKSREFLSKGILELLQAEHWSWEEAIARCFRLLQRTRLFGSWWWSGAQVWKYSHKSDFWRGTEFYWGDIVKSTTTPADKEKKKKASCFYPFTRIKEGLFGISEYCLAVDNIGMRFFRTENNNTSVRSFSFEGTCVRERLLESTFHRRILQCAVIMQTDAAEEDLCTTMIGFKGDDRHAARDVDYHIHVIDLMKSQKDETELAARREARARFELMQNREEASTD